MIYVMFLKSSVVPFFSISAYVLSAQQDLPFLELFLLFSRQIEIFMKLCEIIKLYIFKCSAAVFQVDVLTHYVVSAFPNTILYRWLQVFSLCHNQNVAQQFFYARFTPISKSTQTLRSRALTNLPQSGEVLLSELAYPAYYFPFSFLEPCSRLLQIFLDKPRRAITSFANVQSSVVSQTLFSNNV